MSDNQLISELLETLGFSRAGFDTDEAVAWALVELALRRKAEMPLQVGDRVTVVDFSDEEGDNDSFVIYRDDSMWRKEGVITSLEGGIIEVYFESLQKSGEFFAHDLKRLD